VLETADVAIEWRAPREACRITDQAARLNLGAEPSCELWTEGGRHHRKSRKGDWHPPPLN